jgi:hypothetical protein
MYGSHHQQPQKQGCNDEPDPFLVVREPSMHDIHGQPPPASMLIYSRMTVLVPTPTPVLQ